MEIDIGQDLEAISIKAARLFVSLSKKYIRSSGMFVTALSGGTTPKRFYQILSSDQYRRKIAWGNVHIFWVDERFVPSDHPDSNYRFVHDNLLQRSSIPSHNVHPIITDRLSAPVSAKHYETKIKQFFQIKGSGVLPRFDLMILGIGEDGHTASLFPGSRMLLDREHLVVPVRNRKVLHQRITMTLPVLNSANNIFFLVSGKSKSTVLEKVFMQRDQGLPATLVKPDKGHCLLFFDRDAGEKIPIKESLKNVVFCD
jgi:6-phosphogluconolactonase